MRKIDLEEERKFENSKMQDVEIRSAQTKFYVATEHHIAGHNNRTCQAINNKDVLEIGCSSGEDAVRYAQFANVYYGVDISDVAIEIATARDIVNAQFRCTDGHSLPFPCKKFDCVIVNSLLHHLDLAAALTEINRVLKDDGFLILREPLGINPVFNLYRWKTPEARTVDEAPFSRNDLLLLDKFFDTRKLTYFGLFELLTVFVPFRWFKILMSNMDKMVSTTRLKKQMWQITGILKKRVIS